MRASRDEKKMSFWSKTGGIIADFQKTVIQKTGGISETKINYGAHSYSFSVWPNQNEHLFWKPNTGGNFESVLLLFTNCKNW